MISNQAVIDPSAVIAADVTIGPFSVIGPQVEIGSGTVVGSNVVINGPTKIGKNNRFYQFCSIGEDCQDKKYLGEDTRLEVGDDNVFREGCTVHRGTIQGGSVTTIGSNNLFMVNTHIAHDCNIGSHVVFSNGASVAGHVKVEDYASLGGFVGVHQFCVIGSYSFAAGGSMIIKDVLPFVTVQGNYAQVFGLNTVGLTRKNYTTDQINILKQAYKIIFRTSSTVADAVTQLNPLVEKFPQVALMRDFLLNSARGIIR